MRMERCAAEEEKGNPTETARIKKRLHSWKMRRTLVTLKDKRQRGEGGAKRGGEIGISFGGSPESSGRSIA